MNANEFNNLTYDEKIRYVIRECIYTMHKDIGIISLVYDDDIYHDKMRYFNMDDFETLEEFEEYAYDDFVERIYNNDLIKASIEDYFVENGIN